jgi:tetratricopeptide (TPR) repeat protein
MQLWPGLAPLWTRGSWVGLTVAVGFTALVNLLAATTFVWNEWLSSNVRWSALGTLAVVWLLAWVEGRADWRRLVAELSDSEDSALDPAEQSDRLFCEAQAAYLTGDWVSAEQTLLKLLKHDPRDAEARLMLATLWRHEGRRDDALEQLDRLALLETAAPWQHEIAQERERITAVDVESEDHQEPPSEEIAEESQTIPVAALRALSRNAA